MHQRETKIATTFQPSHSMTERCGSDHSLVDGRAVRHLWKMVASFFQSLLVANVSGGEWVASNFLDPCSKNLLLTGSIWERRNQCLVLFQYEIAKAFEALVSSLLKLKQTLYSDVCVILVINNSWPIAHSLASQRPLQVWVNCYI